LPLPTKHPPKVIEPITKTIANATFCILHPMKSSKLIIVSKAINRIMSLVAERALELYRGTTP
jgi:hypothetical protein